MSFVAIQRPPRQPADACRSVQLLSSLMGVFYHDRYADNQSPSNFKNELYSFLDALTMEFAEGCCIWPLNAYRSASSLSHRLAFEWLTSYLKHDTCCRELVFMCNTSAGFYSYAAICFQRFQDQTGWGQIDSKQWLVCWRKDEIFGHADLVTLRTSMALFAARSCQSVKSDLTLSSASQIDYIEALAIDDVRCPPASVLQAAIDATDYYLFVCYFDGSICYCNSASTKAFGEAVKIMKQHTQSISWLSSIIHPDDLPTITGLWRDIQNSDIGIQEKRLEIDDCQMILENGHTARMRLSIFAVSAQYNKEASSIYWVICARDSNQMELNRRCMIAEDSRTKFLAEMSHEMRTPLSCIIGTTDLIRYTNLKRDQQELLTTISCCSRQLFQLIENMLDFGKIQERKLLLNPASVFLEKAIYEAVQFVSPEIHRKDLDFFLYIAPDVPECIRIDELRLKQILTNLVSNAVKFTADQTMVSVSVKKELPGPMYESDMKCFKSDCCDGKETTNLRFEIDDRGPGLDEGENATLFESYVQLDETIQSKFGGTGLGLAISKRLVSMMGGNIWYESDKSGCKFIFTIQTVAVECPEPKKSVNEEGMTLSKASRILKEYLDSFILKTHCLIGISIHTRSNDMNKYLKSIYTNFTGLNVIKELEPTQRTIIVTDDSMSMEKLYCMLQSNPIIGIIILTRDEGSTNNKLIEANISAKTIRRPINASYLVRITFEVLVESQMADTIGSRAVVRKTLGDANIPLTNILVNTNASSSATTESIPSSEQLSSKYPLNIMIVDDNTINVQLMARILRKYGYNTVCTAESGLQAVEAFRNSSNIGNTCIDCIFMDMEMPEMNGMEATLEIRRMASKHKILSPHIIALTANAFPEDRIKCLDSGMCRYLSKPIKWESLEGEFQTAYQAVHNQIGCRCSEERILHIH